MDFDIGQRKITIPCKHCKAPMQVTLDDVAAEASIPCAECGKSTKLTDQDGKAKDAVKNFNAAIAKIPNKVTIKIGKT